jgi:exosome complex component RRP42
MTELISPVERDFVERGVDVNIRIDGRARDDYRPPHIEIGLIAQSDGSARCQLGDGTDVLVSVRCELGQVVECAPSASQRFEGRGAEELNVELSEALRRALDAVRSGLDLRQLCIVPGLHCWILNIDAIVLNYGGNVLDALMMAVRAALADTRVPRTTVQTLEDGTMDFEVDDDVESAQPLAHVDRVPLCVTANKIGQGYVLDATLIEERCANARLHVSVNTEGQICATQKTGLGSIAPSLLMAMLQAAREQAKRLLTEQDQLIQQHQQQLAAKQARGEPIKRPSIFV